ncbi:pilin [Pseudomonas sp. TE3610]
MKLVNGFTLVELMISLAITGLLAAIAFPAYQKFQSRSAVVAGITETSVLKAGLQNSLSNGDDVSTPTAIGGVTTTNTCSSITASATVSSGGGTITCTLTNAPSSVSGKVITWTLTTASGWRCTTDAPVAMTPLSCPGI